MGVNSLFVILLFLLVLVPTSVFGIPDIENKEIVANSEDSEIVLSLEFGENQFSRFDRAIPTLESGLLVIGDSIMDFTNPILRYILNFWL